MARIFFAFSLFALFSTAQITRAQDPEAEARARFAAGRAAFDAEHYEEALSDFRRAYDLSHRAELLYNVASAAERLARDQEALDAYRAFIEALPDHPESAETRRRITILQARLHAHALPDAPPADDVAADAQPAPPPVAPAPAGYVLSWVGLGLTLGAGVGVGVAWALANDAYASLDTRCGMRGCTDGEIAASDVQARLDATTAMWVVTGVLAAATIVLFVVETPGVLGAGPDARVSIGPGSVSLAGRF